MLKLTSVLLALFCVSGVYSNWVVKCPETMNSVPGSCAFIPCSFDYPNDIQPVEGIDKIWYKDYDNNRKVMYHPMGTSDKEYAGRVEFLGSSSPKNCSVLIKDLQKGDAGTFQFRFEIINNNKWLDKKGVTLQVTDEPLTPDVVFPTSMNEGDSVTFQCSTPYFCPDGSVSLDWLDYVPERSFISTNVHLDTSRVLVTKNLTTSFTWMENQKKIHCAVSVGAQKAEKEITLNVTYPPKGVKVIFQPSGENIKQGNSVTLVCHVNSSNPGVNSYTWYKNGRQFSRDSFVPFHSISRDDHGEYRCEVQNAVGSGSSVTAQLIVFSAWTMVSPSPDIREGESVTLTCDVPGAKPDEVHYSWYKNNVWIKEGSVRSLLFQEATSHDAGYYYCKVQNDKGSDSSPPVVLNIMYAPRVPTLTSFLETQRGNLAIIHCAVDSNPFSELMLYKDGNLIASTTSHGAPTQRIRVISTRDSLRLEIQGVKMSDEGLYSCIAKNSIGNSTSSLQFTVQTARVEISPSTEIEVGKEVTLTCLATQSSQKGTTYTWFKNGKWLKEELEGAELVYHRLSKQNAGSYYCKAQNSQGSSISPSVTLHVLFPPSDLSLSLLVSSQGTFIAVILCTVDSEPPSQLVLYRRETMVASSTIALPNKRYTVSPSINSLQLEIQGVVIEDEGTYTCFADNTYGNTTGSLEFTAAAAKIIVSPPADVREGEDVTLTCSLNSVSNTRNYTYSWYKNSAQYREGTESLLELLQVTSLDSGSYYCKAWNNESSTSSAAVSLNVAYAPRRTQLTSFRDMGEGRSAFIRCSVESYPLAEMSLYREGQLVASSRSTEVLNERYKVSSSLNELTLNIKNIKLEDEGKYNCTSRNSIGSTSESLDLSVQTARVLVTPSTDVVEGAQVKLTCDTMMSQRVGTEYLWYKDSRRREKTSDNYLVIDSIKDQDTGYYHCAAQDSEDSSVSPSVSLHVSYAPRRPVMSSFWEAQGGQIGIIQCSVDSDPPSRLALYHRDLLVGSSDSSDSTSHRMKISSSQNQLKMEISDVMLEDEGTYLCAAKNSIGESRSTITFTTQSTRIVISPSSVVQEGHAVNLTCVVATETSDETTYTWYKNGNNRYLPGTGKTLRFANVTSEERGAYYCNVRSQQWNRTSQSVSLNVLFPPRNIYINSFLDTENGKVAVILGSVDSNPPSEMSLYKDGQLLASSTDSSRSSKRIHPYFFPDTFRLEIRNVMTSDGGTYVIIARNTQGTGQSSVFFTVEGARVLVSPFTELLEGSSVTLTCNVVDGPQAVTGYTWHKNGRWFQEGNAASFGFKKVTSSDAGSYSCIAHSTEGSKSSSPVSISVLHPPRNLSLTTFLEMQERQLGVILCSVDSEPPSQLSLLRGEDVVNVTRSTAPRIARLTSRNTLRLEIKDITIDDQGEYTCQANNTFGMTIKSIYFSVQTARVLISPHEKIHEGHSVNLTCEVPRMDNTTYTWYKNNKWLHEGLQKSLVLPNVSSSDTGSYHCLANHWRGNRVSPLVGLSVLYGPRNLVMSSFLETHGRERGIIMCSADSDPPSTIGLYRNNILLGSSALSQVDRGYKYWSSPSYNYLRLEIRDITAEDSGSYLCTASNTLGTARSSIVFNAKDREALTYMVVSWIAIVFVLFLATGIVALLYCKKIKEKYMCKTDKDCIELDNTETSQK
ncbi:sialoadhesin isoform X2 [Mixophyes fleayi]|uniref:sialoadhesin isoform X2 n=1 Tax=Mixophyes fleayi TaxID=3061075 RepID=UPI003F4DBF4D